MPWPKGRKRTFSEETIAKLRQKAVKKFKNPENRKILSEKLRGRKFSKEHRDKLRQKAIRQFNNPENRRIISEKIKQALSEERVTPIQLPVIQETEFLVVDTVQTDSIRDYFNPFIRQLHAFLNQLPCLRDIQLVRRNWIRNTIYIKAFGNFAIEPRHWYTYNHGGRIEAQFNLGLCKDYFRIGLGFEFTAAGRGDPKIVHETYESFLKVIQQDLDSFQQFVNRDSLEVEYVIKQDGIPMIVNTEETIKWLLNPDSNAVWIFVGRLLERNQDALILADPIALANVIESVFKGFRPIWEKTQIMVKKPEKN